MVLVGTAAPGCPSSEARQSFIALSRAARSMLLVYSISTAMKADSERRSGKRIATQVPTRVRTAQGDQTAQTRDVSSSGVFFYTNAKMEKGTEVELVLILPPELTSGEKCWVCCHATIVRVEEGPQFGLAAQIHHMNILPEAAV